MGWGGGWPEHQPGVRGWRQGDGLLSVDPLVSKLELECRSRCLCSGAPEWGGHL